VNALALAHNWYVACLIQIAEWVVSEIIKHFFNFLMEWET